MNVQVMMTRFIPSRQPLLRAYVEGFGVESIGQVWMVREACEYLANTVMGSSYADLTDGGQQDIRSVTKRASEMGILKKERSPMGSHWQIVPGERYNEVKEFLKHRPAWGPYESQVAHLRILSGLKDDLSTHNKVVIHPDVSLSTLTSLMEQLKANKLGDDLVVAIQHKKGSPDRDGMAVWKG